MASTEPNQAIRYEAAAQAALLAIEITPLSTGLVQSVVLIRVGVAGPA